MVRHASQKYAVIDAKYACMSVCVYAEISIECTATSRGIQMDDFNQKKYDLIVFCAGKMNFLF